MNAWKIIFATVVIFGAGVVTGGLLVHHSQKERPLRNLRPASVRSPQPQPGTPGNLRLEFLRRMQRELDLSQDQREKVDFILKESQERSRRLLEPISPSLRYELQRARDEFRSVLNPEQRTRFDELIKQKRQPARPHSTTNAAPVSAPGPGERAI